MCYPFWPDSPHSKHLIPPHHLAAQWVQEVAVLHMLAQSSADWRMLDMPEGSDVAGMSLQLHNPA